MGVEEVESVLHGSAVEEKIYETEGGQSPVCGLRGEGGGDLVGW
jgi:hypothetical protein